MTDPEKGPIALPPDEPQPAPSRNYAHVALRLFALVVLGRVFVSTSFWSPIATKLGYEESTKASGCVQFDARVPSPNERIDANRGIIFSEEYRLKSVAYHSGLVQIRSESFDDNGAVGEDPRWDVFYDVEAYLRKTFPLLHEKLNLTKVNTHGLVYTWAGSDESLSPSLLMAHQDTVPVPSSTLDYWTYPPWSGHYDGKYVWGRGASDCKNTLSALLEAVTLLLEGGFQPRRTALFAFGFDEESKGWEGAGNISEYLEGVYGKDGIAFIIDEGGLGIGEMYGTAFALPATGEKGYVDVNFTLHTPGGHSSVPPPHTGIGILSSLVTSLESSPYHPSISLSSPIFSLLQCAAEHGELSSGLKSAIRAGGKEGKKGDRARQVVAEKFADLGRGQRYLVSTSQAADVIGGGVKVNALPETSFVVVNYRISVDSTPQFVMDKITSRVLPIAKKHGLDVDAFGTKYSFRAEALTEEGSFGSFGFSSDADVPGGELKITALNTLEPAPVSPTDSAQWELLSSTIQHAYGAKYPDGLIVSPSVMTGNTDTRFTWNLSKHIYRFTPGDRTASFGVHTVDEHLFFDDHIEGIYFFHELLRNLDAAVL